METERAAHDERAKRLRAEASTCDAQRGEAENEKKHALEAAAELRAALRDAREDVDAASAARDALDAALEGPDSEDVDPSVASAVLRELVASGDLAAANEAECDRASDDALKAANDARERGHRRGCFQSVTFSPLESGS